MRRESAFDRLAIDIFGPVQPLGERRTIIGQRGALLETVGARVALDCAGSRR